MMKLKTYATAFFFLCFGIFSWVTIFISKSPIAYPIPDRCQRPFSHKIYDVDLTSVQLKEFRLFVKECFPRDLTFLVYKDEDVKLQNLDFKQGFTITEYISSIVSGTSTAANSIHMQNFDSIPLQNDCAVIGNGGILKGSKCGDYINKHNFVFRMNLAPIKSFEEDVGFKTNITALNFETLENITKSIEKNKTFESYFLPIIHNLNNSILWYSKDVRMNFKSTKLSKLSQRLKDKYKLGVRFAYSWRSVGPLSKWFWNIDVPYPTTGLNTLTVAVSLCDKISLYGFYPFNEDGNGIPIPYHYYDKTIANHEKHNFPKEYEILQRLHKSGFVNMVNKCDERNTKG